MKLTLTQGLRQPDDAGAQSDGIGGLHGSPS
jgi:hypothetical protein